MEIQKGKLPSSDYRELDLGWLRVFRAMILLLSSLGWVFYRMWLESLLIKFLWWSDDYFDWSLIELRRLSTRLNFIQKFILLAVV